MPAAVDINLKPVGASAADEPFLQIKLKGEIVGRRLLNQPRITIGRSSQSDIVLNTTGGVSRNHAHILIVDGEALIEDLSSRNGTFVNGKVCKRRTLKHGDRIAIGRYKLRFRHAQSETPLKRDAQVGLPALMRSWSAAAVTTRVDHCPQCSCDVPADTTDANDGAQTDALPHLVTDDCGDDRTEPQLPTNDRTDESATCAAPAVPTGVAIASDTVTGMAIPFFK
jgi:pSer/pThr/pTyr-binding forkhead associated (FHA) protein